MSLALSRIRSVAAEVGLELLRYLPREQVLSRLNSERSHLESWQNSKFQGEMNYMKRDASLLTQLDHLLANCQSVLCFSVYYGNLTDEVLPRGYGRVARYAWGKDYHEVLRERVRQLSERLKSELSTPVRTRTFTDAVPLLERALAREAQLGFIGKNSMLIRPGLGSYSFLAELLLDVEVVDDEGEKKTESSLRIIEEKNSGDLGSGCGTCDNCKTRCPTTAIVEDGVVDARRCISYLTIEKRTEFSEWESNAIGEWIFGCDVCQDVCPFNQGATADFDQSPRFQEFSASQGVGHALDLKQILAIRDDRDYLVRFAGTALLRTGREGLLRNACSVAANMNYTELIESMREAVEFDSSALIRTAAIQSLKRLEAYCWGTERSSLRNFLSKA